MNATITALNEQLLRRPEPARENLVRYISEHLDEIESDMNDSDEPFELSDEWKAELNRRIDEHERDPSEGVEWEVLYHRLLNSR